MFLVKLFSEKQQQINGKAFQKVAQLYDYLLLGIQTAHAYLHADISINHNTAQLSIERFVDGWNSLYDCTVV